MLTWEDAATRGFSINRYPCGQADLKVSGIQSWR